MILLVLLGMLVGVSDAIMCYDDIELDNVQVGSFNRPYNITILFTSILGCLNLLTVYKFVYVPVPRSYICIRMMEIRDILLI